MLDALSVKVQDAFRFVTGKSSISERNIADAVDAIKVALLDADVNLRVVRRFVNSTIADAQGAAVLRSVDPGQQFIKIVHDKLTSFLGDAKQDLQLKGPDVTSVILMLGLQGSGKTTSAVKLALRLKKEGRKVVLAACDLVRPAAAEQLAVLGENIGVKVHREDGATDPLSVYRNAFAWAEQNLYNTVIVDTTGRLQIDESMMEELHALNKAANPCERLLVADSMTGQSAADIAKAFDEKIGLTGVVLTKFDSDARGGAALSLKTVTGKPLKFIGTGEKLEDLEPFHPERIASRILGMGDVVSFVEKVQDVISEEQAKTMQERIEREGVTLEDYLFQIRSMKKMGSFESLVALLPGARGRMSEEEMARADLPKHEVIITSMTRQERANYLIVGPSRRSRIAKGSGTSVAEVNRLLKRFEKLKSGMRKLIKENRRSKASRAARAKTGKR
jgi:signal recognition particle subunit SRP54